MKKLSTLLILVMSTAICFAQDIIITNEGTALSVFNTEIGESHVFYMKESNSDTYSFINKNEVLIIKKKDGTKIDPSNIVSKENNITKTSNKSEVEWIEDEGVFPTVDLQTYSGFLLEEGNCVYIPHDSRTDFERAGQNVLYKCLKKNNFWTVVNKIEQAHFVVRFITDLKGRDTSYLIIQTVSDYRTFGKYYVLNARKTDERVNINEENAFLFYLNLEDVMKSIIDGKPPYDIKSKFTINPKKK